MAFDNGLGFSNLLNQNNAAALPGMDFGTMSQYGIGGPNGGGGPQGTDYAGTFGAISDGLGAFTSLANIYAGFKALKLQKDQFNFSKEAWNKNYNNQVQDYENNLKDRWAARNASAQVNGRSFQSMDAYLGERALTGS